METVNRHFQGGFAQSAVAAPWGDRWRRAFGFYPGFNIAVVAFAVGVAVYFAWPSEPDWRIVTAFCAVSGGLFWGLRDRANVGTGLIWLIFMVALGFGRGVWHSAAVDAPRLPQQERTYRIEGWVSAIEKSGNSERYVVETLSVRSFSSADMPKRLRIRLTKRPDPPIEVGATINWLISAKAPPAPVVPGGYDPGKAAYFKGIGGFGFGYGAPEAQADAELGFRETMHRTIARWRYGLADRVMAKAPTETAGLQAALMTGVRRYIPAEQTDDLRVAGLAHILAISGLHMALLAGGTYSALVFILACILVRFLSI